MSVMIRQKDASRWAYGKRGEHHGPASGWMISQLVREFIGPSREGYASAKLGWTRGRVVLLFLFWVKVT